MAEVSAYITTANAPLAETIYINNPDLRVVKQTPVLDEKIYNITMQSHRRREKNL